MQDKTTLIRNHILDKIEKGVLKAGEKLPGAREIAKELNISFLKIQNSIDRMGQDGILETVPRKGTFVNAHWNERILQTNFTLFNPEDRLPWSSGLRKILAEKLPHIRVTHAFKNSIFELRTTLALQSRKDEYLDLSEIFDKCYPDKSVFFTHPFKTFYSGKAIHGIPFIFSPRIILYNPEIFKIAGCAADNNWTWEDFMDCIRKLKRILPAERIFNWHPVSHIWINFIFRSGGTLIDPAKADPIKIDSPETQNALSLFMELKKELGLKGAINSEDYLSDFCNGKAAMMIEPREILPLIDRTGFDGWKSLPLPRIKGGADVTAQATDLICVRKSCTDNQALEDFVRVMLSEEVQDFIADSRYGIPIRKSSAFKSINPEEQRDFLFLAEAAKASAQYNINSPELSEMINDAIEQMFLNNKDIRKSTAELAAAVRLFLNIKNNKLKSIEEREVCLAESSNHL